MAALAVQIAQMGDCNAPFVVVPSAVELSACERDDDGSSVCWSLSSIRAIELRWSVSESVRTEQTAKLHPGRLVAEVLDTPDSRTGINLWLAKYLPWWQCRSQCATAKYHHHDRYRHCNIATIDTR